MRKTFNIIDPGLARHVGHHREINLAIAREVVSMGYQVNIFVHKNYQLIESDQKESLIKLIPYFTVSPYAIVKSHKSDVENMIRYEVAQQIFSHQMAELDLTGTVHLSNVFSYQFLALSEIVRLEKISGCIHHHPGRYGKLGEFLWLKSASSARRKLDDVEFFVVEESLINEIDRLLLLSNGVKIAPFPLYFDEVELTKGRTNRIGILGGLRAEQGRENIGKTIHVIRSLGLDVFLQDSQSKSHETITEGVKTTGFIDRFSDAFRECDAILFNYDPDSYRFMGSGVMWESMAHAKPIIHTRGNALASVARKYRAGISFCHGNYASLESALRYYKENRDEFAEQAVEVSKKVRLEHSTERHVRCLI